MSDDVWMLTECFKHTHFDLTNGSDYVVATSTGLVKLQIVAILVSNISSYHRLACMSSPTRNEKTIESCIILSLDKDLIDDKRNSLRS